jgi:DNA replication protein DnaC
MRIGFGHGVSPLNLRFLNPPNLHAFRFSNRSVGEWGTVFGDPVVATAILDHLLHHSQVVTIRGDRDRLREK